MPCRSEGRGKWDVCTSAVRAGEWVLPCCKSMQRHTQLHSFGAVGVHGQENVGGLDIAVQDVALVHVQQREGNLDEDPPDHLLLERRSLDVNLMVQRLAVGVLHDNVQAVRLVHERSKVADDIGVAQLRQDLDLIRRALLLIRRQVSQVHLHIPDLLGAPASAMPKPLGP